MAAAELAVFCLNDHMRNRDDWPNKKRDRDEQFKTKLNEKLQIADKRSLIQVYAEVLSSRLAN